MLSSWYATKSYALAALYSPLCLMDFFSLYSPCHDVTGCLSPRVNPSVLLSQQVLRVSTPPFPNVLLRTYPSPDSFQNPYDTSTVPRWQKMLIDCILRHAVVELPRADGTTLEGRRLAYLRLEVPLLMPFGPPTTNSRLARSSSSSLCVTNPRARSIVWKLMGLRWRWRLQVTGTDSRLEGETIWAGQWFGVGLLSATSIHLLSTLLSLPISCRRACTGGDNMAEDANDNKQQMVRTWLGQHNNNNIVFVTTPHIVIRIRNTNNARLRRVKGGSGSKSVSRNCQTDLTNLRRLY
ncbi:hypothetical protein AAG570_011826 [Ranatra chinensis]|uniref:Uncharacterized protein n=1 Tax=Ranatra chinensis TaxID=642074 RepID=A0ABD0YH09_9HEMI